MSDEKIYVRFEEDAAIVERLDRIAEAEGTTRAAIARRLIRRGLGLFLTPVPESGQCAQPSTDQAA